MTPVIGGEIRRRLDLPGQEAASEGTVSDKRDAQFPDGVERASSGRGSRASIGLERGDGMDLVRAPDRFVAASDRPR